MPAESRAKVGTLLESRGLPGGEGAGCLRQLRVRETEGPASLDTLSCRHGAWAKGTFGNTDASGGHSSSRPHRTTVPPSGKQARTQKEPSEGRCWKGRSKWHLSSVPLAGVAASRMPDEHPKVWKGTASLGKFIVYPVHAIPSSS
ncbi:Calcium uptake protein 3, mitochondrial [Manis javanica]|nr:Calcium uptake protein 3, mitochondrial [Manis javanica]